MKFKINKYVALLIINLPILFVIRLLHVPTEYFFYFFLFTLAVVIIRQYWFNSEES
jgi:hypothetical protein